MHALISNAKGFFIAVALLLLVIAIGVVCEMVIFR